MATRKAYAKSNDGKAGFMFKSKALRDLFVASVDGYENATCAEYRGIERKSEDSVDEWGNTVRFSPFIACDMDVVEHWDGWWDVYDKAVELGIA